MSDIVTKERQRKNRHTVFPMTRIKIAEPDAESGKRRIEGYAAVFGNRDSYGDVIMPGAFARSLKERPDVKVLWQHDTEKPIGKQVAAFEDEFGLRAQGELSNIPLVTNEVVPLLEDGVVTGLSIGYDVVEEEYNSDLGSWFLHDIDLWEWSPVTFPANELAQVTGVKSLDGRAGVHTERVNRYAKSLHHELTGFFAKDARREDLDEIESLDQLRKLLLGEEGVPEADSDAIEQAYFQGGLDALDALEQANNTTATKE